MNPNASNCLCIFTTPLCSTSFQHFFTTHFFNESSQYFFTQLLYNTSFQHMSTHMFLTRFVSFCPHVFTTRLYNASFQHFVTTRLYNTTFQHFFTTHLRIFSTRIQHVFTTRLYNTSLQHFFSTRLYNTSSLPFFSTLLFKNFFTCLSLQQFSLQHVFLNTSSQTLLLDTSLQHFFSIYNTSWQHLFSTSLFKASFLTLPNSTSFQHFLPHFTSIFHDFHQNWPSTSKPQRDFHHNWPSTLPKRAFSPRLSPKDLHFQKKHFPRDVQHPHNNIHETCHKRKLSDQRSETQIPMAERYATPLYTSKTSLWNCKLQ